MPALLIKRSPQILAVRFYGFLDWVTDDIFSSQPARRVPPMRYIRPELEGLSERVMLNATTWTGAMDTDWMKAGNWNNGVPIATSDVTINNVTNAPVISAN